MQNCRRKSLDTNISPPNVYANSDLGDIHEYQTDQQYRTHNGNFSHSDPRRRTINNDTQRNSIFHSSFDEPRVSPRFDNTSFARNIAELAEPFNQSASSPKEKSAKSSLHGMLKSFGKKAHIWPRKRHESTSTCNFGVTSPINDPQEQFRSRSKSLDVNYTGNMILSDCDATYKIFDRIVREGKHVDADTIWWTCGGVLEVLMKTEWIYRSVNPTADVVLCGYIYECMTFLRVFLAIYIALLFVFI